MRRCLMLLILSLVLSLTACAALTSTSSPGDTALAKVKAGAAYLTASLAKVRQAVAEVRDKTPELAAAVEAKVGPALATLESEVAAYTTAVSDADTVGANALWPRARAALTTALGVVVHLLPPMLGG